MDGSKPPMKGRIVYDRTTLRAAAQRAGDLTPSDSARRLGVARNTAWRLWTGTVAPSAAVAAAVEVHYGVSAAHLITRTAA
ncbi:helix-turn-helix domain-containing protein [Streptomyces sp. NPDC047046]|uniref:helix-turn-helix domain-containing protein n=1 Tax=Streptomyces sp. NPDC047046 TaxID=3155378 RepID=UPI0034051932